ncbi:MAG: methylated-DNA--[protein]-cysteine S-methyltransferase [Terricaulis sp.]
MISTIYEGPIGKFTLVSNGAALLHLDFETTKTPAPSHPRGADKVLDKAKRELDAYFAGKLKQFTVAVAPQGTEFQRRCWAALQKIPYGQTRTYGQQAVVVGNPKAMRAVGLANGRNPIAVIIPCHRVIGADGSLTGFGGGLPRKKFLLGLEAGEGDDLLLMTGS